jgi:hypothetical protein
VIRFPELRRELAAAGVDIGSLGPSIDLQLLFLSGSADQAVPYFGCRVTPANVEEVVLSVPELAGPGSTSTTAVKTSNRLTPRLRAAPRTRSRGTRAGISAMIAAWPNARRSSVRD